jgi:hypothetical protein
MANRKQRRRRAKTFRHESAFVVLDDDGNEVEVDPADYRPEKAKSTAKAPSKGAKPASRGGRVVPPPTWQRAFKKGGLFGIGLIAVVLLTQKGAKAQYLPVGIIYAVALIPLVYWVDRYAYRAYLKRSGKG